MIYSRDISNAVTQALPPAGISPASSARRLTRPETTKAFIGGGLRRIECGDFRSKRLPSLKIRMGRKALLLPPSVIRVVGR
jgi:hypothetical protein